LMSRLSRDCSASSVFNSQSCSLSACGKRKFFYKFWWAKLRRKIQGGKF
jgi:hypothetical protein